MKFEHTRFLIVGAARRGEIDLVAGELRDIALDGGELDQLLGQQIGFGRAGADGVARAVLAAAGVLRIGHHEEVVGEANLLERHPAGSQRSNAPGRCPVNPKHPDGKERKGKPQCADHPAMAAGGCESAHAIIGRRMARSARNKATRPVPQPA